MRAVTHLAATGFFFLMGVGQGLGARAKARQGWGWARITGQFLLRGALLIAVQLAVVNRSWELSPSGWVVRWYFGVLFALGGGLLLTAPLARLKPWMHLALALAAAPGLRLVRDHTRPTGSTTCRCGSASPSCPAATRTCG